MVILLVLCVVGVTLLLMPETFAGFGRLATENPVWGIGFLVVLVLVLSWGHKH